MKYILGMGNPLRGDDGIGPRIIEYMQQNIPLDGFRCRDIGTNIWNLLPLLETETEHILIIDCAEMDRPLGTSQIFSLEQVITESRLSLAESHNGDLNLLINWLTRAEEYLPKLSMMGIEGNCRKYHDDLSKTLQEKLPEYSQLAIEYIKET